MYLENSRVLGQEIEDGYTRMSEEKGLSDVQRMYAYNENVRILLGCAIADLNVDD